jgi:hypothetical protein
VKFQKRGLLDAAKDLLFVANTRRNSHMLRHFCGYKLANDGQDTRAIGPAISGAT